MTAQDTRPLRILQVLRAPIGGLFRHVLDLSHELAARGHQIGIVTDTLASDAQTEGKLAKLAPAATLGIHRFAMPRVFGPQDLTTPFKVRALADRLQIDVVHGHGAKGGVAARLARLGAPHRVALYTPHGGVLNYKPGSLTGGIFRQIERLITPMTDAIVFESAFAQRAYHAQIGVPQCLGPVIHNGLTPDEFAPVAFEEPLHDFVFLGEFRPVKGLDVLLDALKPLKRPDGTPATAILGGDGPLMPHVRERVANEGLSGRVTLPGVQSARQIFAKGRIMVVPSFAESLPYVILEAAAAQRPVIATHVGGNDEIFGPTADRLIPAGDADALRIAMQAALDDPAAAEAEMAIRLKHISAGFSLERMVDGIEALYRQCLAARGA